MQWPASAHAPYGPSTSKLLALLLALLRVLLLALLSLRRAPPPAEGEVLPEQFHRRLTQAYDQLLEGINAGSPPDLATMSERIETARQNFLTQTLQKGESDSLDPDEETQLREALTQTLESRGYKVVAAESRTQGYDLMDELAPDILILDDPGQERAYRLVWLDANVPDTRIELLDLEPSRLSSQLEGFFDERSVA